MKCKGRVYGSGAGLKMPAQCSKNAVVDGYCRTHHPAIRQSRQRERDARKMELYEAAMLGREANKCPYCNGTGEAAPTADTEVGQ